MKTISKAEHDLSSKASRGLRTAMMMAGLITFCGYGYADQHGGEEADSPEARRIPSAPNNSQHTVPEMQSQSEQPAQSEQTTQDQSSGQPGQASEELAEQGPGAAQDQQQNARRSRGGLSDWNMSQVYRGFSAEQLLDAQVQDFKGKEIGKVENLVVSSDGRIQAVIAKVGQSWDTGTTHVAVPWKQVQLARGTDAIRVPVNKNNLDKFSLSATDRSGQRAARQGSTSGEQGGQTAQQGQSAQQQQDAQQQEAEQGGQTARQSGQLGREYWRITELLDETVSSAGNRRYGTLDDVIFDRNGRMQAIIINRDASMGTPYGPYAYPHQQQQGQGFDWVARIYVIPYTEGDLRSMSRFEYGKLEGADQGETAEAGGGSQGNEGQPQSSPSGSPQTSQ